VANSYHPNQQDSAIGTLLSPVFTIQRDHLSLLVGGGNHRETRVELLMDEARVVRSETGGETEAMSEVVWDTRDLRDQQARIRIVDEDSRGPWGHILVDRIAEW
jgi:hypothetical protein